MAVLANAKVDLGDAIDTPAVSDVDQESGLDASVLREGELFEDRAATRELATQRLLDHAEFGKEGGGHGASHQFGRAPAAATGRGAVVKALDEGDLGSVAVGRASRSRTRA